MFANRPCSPALMGFVAQTVDTNWSRRWRGVAGAMAVCAVAVSAVPALAQVDDLTGPAWSQADRAYRAYEAKDFREAVEAARQAVALRPDLTRLRVLLVNSLAAAGDLRGAIVAADQAIDAGVGADELKGIRERLAGQIAPPAAAPVDPGFAAADAGYKAFARKDYAAAIGSARQAVALVPGNAAYRLLLINALVAAGRLAEAEGAATAALAGAPGAAELRLQRGYIRQRLGHLGPAMDDLSRALREPGLTAGQKRSARLALADAALASKDAARALAVLSPLAAERGYDVQARRGFALQALGRQEEALAAFTLARAGAGKRAERAAMTRGAIAALVALERKSEARALFSSALSSGELTDMKSLDVAYLANQVGDDPTADDYFTRADRRGELKGLALLDAAFVAKRRFDNTRAEDLFRRAIDAQASGQIDLTPQRLLEIRREVTNVSRTWGANASMIYGPVGVSGNPGFAIPASGSNTLQVGGEVYWRPPVIGNRNGATVELFARAFETLYDGTGGATGPDTIQGSFGARWKPLSEHNLILEASRLVPFGDLARYDWLLRLAYSKGAGGELRYDVSHWLYWQIYGEVDRFTEVHETLANGELRFGHSFRVPATSENVVATPFLVAGVAYDSLLATTSTLGVGIGGNLRFWFRQDRYSGPASYLDLTLQYRVKVAGDHRGGGWFFTTSISY
jgi:tetratricopeptide (TPR) repeat protein